jgi:hypothetical protein
MYSSLQRPQELANLYETGLARAQRRSRIFTAFVGFVVFREPAAPCKAVGLAARSALSMSVIAPVWAAVRFSPACLIKNVAMTRWTICSSVSVVVLIRIVCTAWKNRLRRETG